MTGRVIYSLAVRLCVRLKPLILHYQDRTPESSPSTDSDHMFIIVRYLILRS